MRCIRLASATAAALRRLSSSTQVNHGPLVLSRSTAWEISAKAPAINSRLSSRWPIFDLLPIQSLPPAVCCSGIRSRRRSRDRADSASGQAAHQNRFAALPHRHHHCHGAPPDVTPRPPASSVSHNSASPWQPGREPCTGRRSRPWCSAADKIPFAALVASPRQPRPQDKTRPPRRSTRRENCTRISNPPATERGSALQAKWPSQDE